MDEYNREDLVKHDLDIEYHCVRCGSRVDIYNTALSIDDTHIMMLCCFCDDKEKYPDSTDKDFKLCSICNVVKHVSHFIKYPGDNAGYYKQCKRCQKRIALSYSK